MLKHTSFVLNSNKKPKVKIRTMSTESNKLLEPKLAVDTIDIDSKHYDNNEPITLSLPQSLNVDQDVEIDDAHGCGDEEKKSNMVSKSQSYQPEEDEYYSEANSYFNHSNAFSETTQAENDTRATDDSSQSSEKETIETHEAVVMDPNDIEDDESIVEQDKKFEEDIRAILTNKKHYDKERVKNNPEEAIKDKNQGIMGKNEGQNLEDKMKNDHAIFDKIAQSMNMANSYDLGSIAMDKKFDNLEKETDKDFTKKIHDLLQDEKNEADKKEQGQEQDDVESLKKAVEILHDDDDKIGTKDFLKDLDQLDSLKFDKNEENKNQLSTQASFNSTISIKHRYLKSRVFAVSGSSVEVMINSHWNPVGCSQLTELNVTLTKSIDYWPDDEKGTQKFRIGGPDTKTWNNLEPGNYYLTFFFVNNTNPYCELKGTVEVKA